MEARPQREHQWLQQLVGEWAFDVEAKMETGCPPEHFRGTEVVRSLGGLWIVAEGHGEMPGGGAATTLMSLGFDPQRRRYVGTWIGSMMTHLWLYEGTLDAAGTVLTLDTEGPAMTGEGMMARFQDVIEILTADHRRLSSRTLGKDGNWRGFMTADYRRKG